MAASPRIYRRFPGTGRYLLSRVKLYIGPDHLLQITATGYSEVYRRFFFRDIQVLSLHKTIAGTIWNLVWGALLFLFLGLSLSTGPEAIPYWLVVSSVVALLLGFNIARGPTCACYVQTAVQQQRLYSLNRIRRARRLIERVRPLLLATQQPAAASPLMPEPVTAETPTPAPVPEPSAQPEVAPAPAPSPPEAS
jgi:hypothetical protein